MIQSFTMALKRTYQHSVNRQQLTEGDDEGWACVRMRGRKRLGLGTVGSDFSAKLRAGHMFVA